MLTRHLYRYDEVKASLLYCILVQRYEEAFFWSLELFDSLGGGDVFTILVKTWMTCIGWRGFGFLKHFQGEEFDEDVLYKVMYTLMSYKERDASVYGLILRGAQVKSQVDTVVPMSIPEWLDKLPIEFQYVWRAIKQKKVLLAWTMLKSFWSKEDSWNFLDNTAEPYQKETLKFFKTSPLLEDMEWERRALILLCLCSDKKAFQDIVLKDIPEQYMVKKEEWSLLEGRRARRVHKIPTEAILWGTRRSLEPNTQTNMNDLLNILPSLQGSPYWEEVASSMGSWKHIRKVDEMKEAFYDMYFVDDIPDEWSVKDREKSHGYGLLINGNKTIQQMKGWRSLLGRLPSLGLVSFTHDAIQKYNWEYTSFEEAYSHVPEIQWNFEIKKKKIVVKK